MNLAMPTVLLLSLLLPDAAQATPPASCKLPPGILSPSDLPEGTSVERCAAVGRTVRFRGISLAVPWPGTGVSAEADYGDRPSTEFGVTVASDGTIDYSSIPAPTEAGATAAARGPGACTDGAYTDKDEKQYHQWLWYLGDGKRPEGMSTAVTLSRLKDSVDNITASFNDCGMSDQVSASASYQGVSSRETQISTSKGESTCAGSGDGHSVVDFGNLDDHGDPPIALECTWTATRWFANDVITESDVRFNTTDMDWTNTLRGCANAYDLESVATHEFGHSFGMGHVSEEGHGNLTMSGETRPCSFSERTLGRGDILGLRNTY